MLSLTDMVGVELRLKVNVVRLSVVELEGVTPLVEFGKIVIDRLIDDNEDSVDDSKLLVVSVVEVVSEPVLGMSVLLKGGVVGPDTVLF